MSIDELVQCPQCKQGFLRPTGRVATLKDQASNSDTRDYECDNCGRKLTAVEFKEYVNSKSAPS